MLDSLRVSYQYRDDTYLYVLPDQGEGSSPLRVRYNVAQVNDEFAETCRLLWKDAQLNLLDVSVDDDDILTPTSFILEPDYLFDISTLAECFRDYGAHPLNHLFARLQPAENTAALLLGNIANLFLDEWVHATGEPDYKTVMQKAFRLYALELAACTDLLDSNKEMAFFIASMMHFEHIRRTVLETFPAPGYELDKNDALLEPSYICEALGLQGRLDYMQRDMSSFIEMKSGKANEQAGKVLPRENNLVQMLLYQAVLQYSMKQDHRHVHAYLLYTRYPMLYPAHSSWAQVRHIMDVRNRLVAQEHEVRRHHDAGYTATLLEQLTPETLNERRLANTLWKRFQAPRIQELHDSFHCLSEAEKRYFCTLYNFITDELYIAKTGKDAAEWVRTPEEGITGAAALWRNSLQQKCEAGEILYDLTIRESRAGEEHQPTVTFTLPRWERDDDEVRALPNFRVGDAVLLYQRDTDADKVTNRLVFKGNIERLTDAELCIRLRAAQRNEAVLPETARYAIEHDSTMDSTFRSMYRGLSAFLAASPRRRALLLGERPPEFDAAYDEAIAAASDDFARIALKAQAARDYFLLVGPPGTGKTSRALRAMVEAFHTEGKQVLLLSYTNRAVDEICKMLSAITPEIEYIRIGSELACDAAYRPHLLENALGTCTTRQDVRQRLEHCRIFVGTVATLSAKADLFRLKRFDVALVDEATQILEPQLLGLLCREEIGKFVLVGDHKQLPAVILQSSERSAVQDEVLQALGFSNLKNSLFERLYRTFPSSVDMLTRQGRMHPDVARYANALFYEDRLQSVGLPHQLEQLDGRVVFYPVASVADEAKVAARLAVEFYRNSANAFDAAQTLGIIAPFRTQIALVRRELAATGIPALQEVLVDTVERFQGSERDVIIYSFCADSVARLRFLSNLTEENGVLIDRKLNVALTRARKQLFLVGIPEWLKQNPIYKALLEEIG